ncbi:MAG TPA: hypothetical protein VF546_14410 [Pyrinomonadaceae bacterium]|jgi:hypothetical protein
MMIDRLPTAALLSAALLLACGAGARAQVLTQRPLRIAEAKAQLEQLQAQLLRVEAEAHEQLEREVAAQVSTAPRGEFETSKAYEARKAKANELRQRLEEESNRRAATRKEDLNRRINEILTTEFALPFEPRLGTYDADAQRFPVSVPPDGHETILESVAKPQPVS